jgi:hypothetical protein
MLFVLGMLAKEAAADTKNTRAEHLMLDLIEF